MNTLYKQNINVSHKGFTLVEVMIALVVMAVGMLGLASIQAVGLANNTTAYNRTIAMQSAYNMADIIRTHKSTTGVVTGTFASVDSTVPGSAPGACIVNSASACTAATMAAVDIYEWKLRLDDLLPSGRGAVTLNSGVYEIKVMWDENRRGVTGEGCDPTDTDDLKCYMLHVQI